MKVYAAINQVMKEISKTGISKDHKNQQQGYSFRGIDDIYNALCPLLANAGLVIIPRVMNREVVERQSAKGGALFCVTVEVEFDFVAAEDHSVHTGRAFGEAMDPGDKATNKAMSAAYKYICMQTFAIPTEGDNDADSTTQDVLAIGVAEVKALALAALDRKDWAAIWTMDRNSNDLWLRAWGMLDSKDRTAITKLKAVRDEYRVQLVTLAESDDADGFDQVQSELSLDEARHLCTIIAEPAKHMLIEFRKAEIKESLNAK